MSSSSPTSSDINSFASRPAQMQMQPCRCRSELERHEICTHKYRKLTSCRGCHLYAPLQQGDATLNLSCQLSNTPSKLIDNMPQLATTRASVPAIHRHCFPEFRFENRILVNTFQHALRAAERRGEESKKTDKNGKTSCWTL